MKKYDHVEECIVCQGEMPSNRHLTCSPDCYTIWMVDRWRAKRRMIKAFTNGGRLSRPATIASKIKGLQNAAKGKHKRNCDYCGTQFMAQNTKQYYCTPQCSILGKNNGTYSETARRTPSLPKMPWDTKA